MTKQVNYYKRVSDEIEETFGGINSVREQIKIAKLKESSVGTMVSNLETCIVSTYFSLLNNIILLV